MTDAPESTLLHWLLLRFPDTPKSRAKQWIQAGRVRVNGQPVRKPHQVMRDPGDGLQLGDRGAATLDCGSGWQIHPRVALLFLDSSLAIVNKGPGLISVPSEKPEITALSILRDFLLGKLKAASRGPGGKTLPPAYRNLEPLPVHRLDQYTSGVFCMATNPEARRRLIDQLQARTMKREYVAYAEGRPSQPSGTWREWLQLSSDGLRQQIVSEPQSKAEEQEIREAITHYEVIREYALPEGKGIVSKLRLRLESGRKHQIRIQAANAGIPLIGDRTYHPGYRKNAEGQPLIEFPRQALHAEKLSLEHPDVAGRRMSWVADLPKDLRHLETVLQQGKVFQTDPIQSGQKFHPGRAKLR